MSIPSPIMTVATKPENNITFNTAGNEMLRVAEDGFYVRGKKLEVDDQEALAVYKAFRSFLVYHGLSRD